MNRRGFLKSSLFAGMASALSGLLPDSALAREVGLRDVQIEAEVKRFRKATVRMKIGDEDYQELQSLTLRVKYVPDNVLTLGINKSDSFVEYKDESSIAVT